MLGALVHCVAFPIYLSSLFPNIFLYVVGIDDKGLVVSDGWNVRTTKNHFRYLRFLVSIASLTHSTYFEICLTGTWFSFSFLKTTKIKLSSVSIKQKCKDIPVLGPACFVFSKELKKNYKVKDLLTIHCKAG